MTRTTLDTLTSEYSDLYKELNGFRPRRSFASEADAQAALDALYRRQAEDAAREAAEREAFRAKVAALGLDPDKYMSLA